MTVNLSSLLVLGAWGGIVTLCLIGICRVRSQAFHERWHFLFSLLPWLHMALYIAVAAYVRIGFGSWPRSCIDNPKLPMLDGLVMGLVIGLLIIPIGGPVWLGWLIIRLRRDVRRYWIWSTAAFVTGMVAMIAVQWTDPWGFWSWVWD